MHLWCAQGQLSLYSTINKSCMYIWLYKCNHNTCLHVCIAVVLYSFFSCHVKGWSQITKSLLPTYINNTEFLGCDAMSISQWASLWNKQIVGHKIRYISVHLLINIVSLSMWVCFKAFMSNQLQTVLQYYRNNMRHYCTLVPIGKI